MQIASSSLPNMDSVSLRKSTSSPELSPPTKEPIHTRELKKDDDVPSDNIQGAERRSRSSEAGDVAASSHPRPVSAGISDYGVSQPIDIPGNPDSLVIKMTSSEQALDNADAAPRRSRSSTTVSDREKPRRVSIAEPPRRTPSVVESSSMPVMNHAGDGSSAHGGVTPSFIFLQLHHSNLIDCGEDRPLLLPKDNKVSVSDQSLLKTSRRST